MDSSSTRLHRTFTSLNSISTALESTSNAFQLTFTALKLTSNALNLDFSGLNLESSAIELDASAIELKSTALHLPSNAFNTSLGDVHGALRPFLPPLSRLRGFAASREFSAASHGISPATPWLTMVRPDAGSSRPHTICGHL
jgi:hypothetical protein